MIPALVAFPAAAEDGPPQQPTTDSPSGQTSGAPIEILEPLPKTPRTPADTQPGFATRIDLASLPFQAATLSDYLELSPGVQVVRTGGPGSFSTLSVRGASSGQLALYQDGLPLTSSGDGVLGLDSLALENVERIELYRGSSPLAFGANALGGVLHLVSRTPQRPLELRVTTGVGSFGDGRAGLQLGLKRGTSDLLFSLGARTNQGDYPYFSDGGTPYNTSDDTTRTLSNHDVSRLETSLRLQRRSPRRHLTLSGSGVVSEQGVLGLGQGQLETSARYSLARAAGAVQLGWMPDPASPSPSAPLLRVHSQLEALIQQDRFVDPEGEVSLAPEEQVQQGVALGGLARAEVLLGSRQVLDAVLVGRVEAARRARGEPGDAHEELASHARTRMGLGVQDEWGWRSLQVVPGLLLDQVWGRDLDPLTLVSPRIGLGWRLPLPGRVVLRSSAGGFHRLPTFFELYGNQGSVVGNPALLPEQGIQGELGISARASRSSGPQPASPGNTSPTALTTHLDLLELEVVGFLARTEDLILYSQNSQNTVKAINIAASDRFGLELSGILAGKHLEARVGYTWLEATDRSGIPSQDGLQLPGRPRHAGSLLLTARLPTWTRAHLAVPRPLPGPLLWYRLDAASETALEPAHLRLNPARVLHGLGLSVEWPGQDRDSRVGRWRLSLEAHNLLDVTAQAIPGQASPQMVMDTLGFPLPGRALYLSLAWRT